MKNKLLRTLLPVVGVATAITPTMCLTSCGKKFEYYIDDSALDGIKYTTKKDAHD